MERALTKIEQYNTNNDRGRAANKQKAGLANLDPLPQIDGLSKIL